MGLDIVELGMAIEEEFGIAIPDSDYQTLSSVGETERYICRRLNLPVSQGELFPPDQGTAYRLLFIRAFCKVRRTLMQSYGIPRKDLRPSSRISVRWSDNASWELAKAKLVSELGWSLPDWTNVSLAMCILGTAAWLFIGMLVAGISPWIAIFPVGVGTLSLMQGWQRRCEFQAATVGDIVRYACTYNLQHLREELLQPSEYSGSDVLPRLLLIVSEQLSIPLDEIRRESRYIEDLGAD